MYILGMSRKDIPITCEDGNMGRMLNMLEAVITRARHLQDLGQTQSALSLLRRHASQPELPKSAAAEAHHLMGKLCLNLQQHRQARKHLTAAIRLRPNDAAANHLMAHAIDQDPEMDAQSAARYYRRAVELNPNDSKLLADTGLFHVEMGRLEKGLALLRQAVELAPDDLDVLQSLLAALGELDRFDEAWNELNKARFRHFRDPHFLKLVSDLEFAESRHRQRDSKPVSKPASAAVVPFLRVITDDGTSTPATRFRRRDEGSASRPHLGRSARRSDKHRVK
jgi:tetratricopeptide (TPR) repeat protein